MRFILFLLSLVAASQAVSMFTLILDEWETFKLQHNKNYTNNIEDKFRMKIFIENRHKIAIHNKLFAQGLHSFEVGMNHFGDLLHHEFVSMMNGFKRNYNESRRVGATYIAPANVEIPAQVDWRTQGAVTPVKNQGQCGSCWAFSTTGSLEGQHFRKIGKLVSLSEQNLVDCSGKYGNNGCNGGLMDNAFQYIKDNGGIDTEKAYPYEGIDDSCHYQPRSKGATDKGYVDVEVGNEDKLKSAVATVGPVSIAIDASHESFQFYKSGVYYETECSTEALDHGVLVVGYGTDSASGSDYWLVKNSWGEEWGLAGYIQMSRNRDNNCGIASQASYPLV